MSQNYTDRRPQSNKPSLSFRGQQSHRPAVRPHLNTVFPPKKNHPCVSEVSYVSNPSSCELDDLEEKALRGAWSQSNEWHSLAVSAFAVFFCFFFVADQSCFFFLRVTCWLSPAFFFLLPPPSSCQGSRFLETSTVDSVVSGGCVRIISSGGE